MTEALNQFFLSCLDYLNELFYSGPPPSHPHRLKDGNNYHDYSEGVKKLFMFVALNFHYYLFLIGIIVRYTRHKNLGIINLNDPRPKTYKFKIALQIIMGVACLSMVYDTNYDLDTGKYYFDPLALIYIVFAFTWFLSIML